MENRKARNASILIIIAALTLLAFAVSPVSSFAAEATEIGPGSAQGTPLGLAGKGEGPWAKAGSTLRRVFAAHHAHQQAGSGAPFKPDSPSVRYANGMILIDAVAADGDGAALLADLQGLGLTDGTAFGAVVSGRMPLGRLGHAVELGSLRAVSASLKPHTNSAVDPIFGWVHDRRGAIAMGLIASEADLQSHTGAGIKVGVLSDTFDNNGGSPATNADDDLANGDLPGGAGVYVALHTPGNADFNDSSSFGAIGNNGINTTIDSTQFALDRDLPEPDGSIRFSPPNFNEDPITAVVSYPDANQYTIGTKPFTIEMWVNFETVHTDGRGPTLASHYSTTNNQRAWFLQILGPDDNPPFNHLRFWLSSDGFSGTGTAITVNNPWVPSPDQWYHVAVTRDDQSDVRMFIDGSMIGDPVNITRSIHNSTAPLRISSYDSSAGNNRPLDGWVEDFRFVVGEALYTENFPLPTEPLASELPPPPGPVAATTVLPDGEGNNPGIDEGRAMMQLIHDVAPDADLSFHTAFNGLADFAQGIQDLADDGADVIVDDIIYFAEPMFQDGIVAQAVDNVVSQGVAYFSSAGNSAQRSYDAPFQASGERLFVGDDDRGMLHDFNPGPGGPVDYLQSVTIPVGTTFIAVLQWDQPFASNCPNPQPPQGCPGPDNDADIYLVEKSGNNLQIVTSSITDNLTSGEPVEVIQFQNPGFFFGEDYHIMITHFDVVTPQHPQPGPPPGRLKYVWFASPSVTVNEHTTDSPASYGHANASGAEAVGAAFYLDTPGGDPNGVLPEPILDPILEWFSSVGGVPILFDKNGNPQAPEVRQKPEIVAPDGTNTTFFGSDTSADDDDEAPETFPNFFGTSAAAPHAAAIAALMLEANPGLSPAQIYSDLEDTALDILQRRAVVRSDPLVTIPNGVGVDDHSGYGLIDATAAIANVTGDLLPLANDDSATTGIDAPVAIDVLGDDAFGDGLTQFTIVSGPANGGAVI
ncbi:MAG: LamG-like jellyroll fold domain-containing protein, partial [Planctomycetota bacterium]